MSRGLLAAAVFAGLLCIAPARPGSVAEASSAEAELLALHQADRRAHFARDVDALLATLPEKFIYVRDGRIEVDSREDLRNKFAEYFQNSEFTAWDDLEQLIVRASPDGRMGRIIVRVEVAFTKPDKSGKKGSEETVMAWMSAYGKRERKWMHVANVTTTAP